MAIQFYFTSLKIIVFHPASSMDQEILSIANEFLVTYYQRFTFSSKEVIKFYKMDAYIYRQQFEEKYGKELGECAPEQFLPKIQHGSQVNIVDYSVLPIENGFNLIVQGNIVELSGNTTTLNQYFTIMKQDDKYFIVADSLYLAPANEKISVEGLEEVPQRRGRSPKNTQEGEKKEEPAKAAEINPKKVQQPKKEQPKKEQSKKDDDRFKEYIPGK